jgi:hypothetical protein
VQDVDLARLGDHLGQVVRVGGLVAAIEADGVDLEDGTATVRLIFAGETANLIALLGPGDALNAVGTPERRGEVVLVVEDPAGLVLAGNLATSPPDATLPPGGASRLPGGVGTLSADIAQGMALDPGSAGLGTLLLLTATSVLVTAARRHRARRVLQARIVARLTALGRAAPGAGTDDHA